DSRQHLPRGSCRAAADFNSSGLHCRLPGRPFLHRLGGRRRGPARSCREACANHWGGALMILAVLGAILIIAGAAMVVRALRLDLRRAVNDIPAEIQLVAQIPEPPPWT